LPPILLDLLYLIIFILGLPFAIYKTLTSARFRAGWPERLGRVPDLPPGPRIWIHAASVGEVILARTLIDRLRREYPAAQLVLSTITSTGRETAQKHFPGLPLFYFPLDLSFAIRKVFGVIKPSAVVLVELELWPNFLTIARRRGVPVVVVNGRITERSVRRYRPFGPLARRQFANVSHFAVQTEEYARRIETFGVPRDRITVAGTMKYDTVSTGIPAETVAACRQALRLRPDDLVLVGGSTHAGEDELLIDFLKTHTAHGSKLRLILAPRHGTRVPDIERLVRQAGMLPVRKTDLDRGAAPPHFEDQPHVIVLDTTGELARLYAVATVVFVGGSLVPHGGQNMIEPAALGKAVVFGPHTGNFRETVDLLLAAHAALVVETPDLLAPMLEGLLGDPAQRAELGRRAQRLIEQQKGATERNFRAIQPVLDAAVGRGVKTELEFTPDEPDEHG